MKSVAMTAISLSMAASALAQDTGLQIARNGSQASARGPADYFTGTVRVDPLFPKPREPSRATGSYVTFEPGARTAWHTHPIGQTLIVTAGTGCVQRWGDPVQEIRPGDVVWIPPGQKHWHGASPTTAMTHIAITEQLDGKAVDWLEKVSDTQYGSRP
ncbi:Cupin domain protein [Variovorax sp. CF079]|uniref:(R)-mandelonitrile lyase n=1 Tax=Variovorax sp. CF079 TaxID=1882774 RepID=UPI000883C908|nr:cupin domain-containing protein [Variovorax sp. CF079]SDD32645.1 Cupin domain protein [Variovorax sp. CF079]